MIDTDELAGAPPDASKGHVRVWSGPRGLLWSVTVHVGTTAAEIDAALAIATAASERLANEKGSAGSAPGQDRRKG